MIFYKLAISYYCIIIYRINGLEIHFFQIINFTFTPNTDFNHIEVISQYLSSVESTVKNDYDHNIIYALMLNC